MKGLRMVQSENLTASSALACLPLRCVTLGQGKSLTQGLASRYRVLHGKLTELHSLEHIRFDRYVLEAYSSKLGHQ